MKKNRLPVLMMGLALLFSCEGIYFEEDPKENPRDVFEMFWRDYDRYYSHFELKGLNWDSVYVANSKVITPNTTDKQLFELLRGTVNYLKDRHATLCAKGFSCTSYVYQNNLSTNKVATLSGYFSLQTRSTRIQTAFVGTDIGYVAVKNFDGDAAEFTVIDEIIDEFNAKDLKGMILDIRGNLGGSDINAGILGGRFTSAAFKYGYVRYRNGPGHGEFGPWTERTLVPRGKYYDKPVVLLTNRENFSAAESFVMAMKLLDQVTVMGDTTGGSSGNPVARVLPNNWTYNIPRWQEVDLEMRYHEGGFGIYPDITLTITAENQKINKDTILESAIEFLRQ